MSTTTYDIGDTVRMSLTVQGSTGAYTATTVRLVIQTPSTEVVKTSTQLTSTATGRYRYDYIATAAGRYGYHFNTTGVIVGSEGGAFAVRRKRATT